MDTILVFLNQNKRKNIGILPPRQRRQLISPKLEDVMPRSAFVQT